MGEVDEQHELCCVCLERLPSAPVVALLTADRAPRSGTAACDHLLHEVCASQLPRPFRCPICRAPFAALARVPKASELLAHHGATLVTTARIWSGDVARAARRCARGGPRDGARARRAAHRRRLPSSPQPRSRRPRASSWRSTGSACRHGRVGGRGGAGASARASRLARAAAAGCVSARAGWRQRARRCGRRRRSRGALGLALGAPLSTEGERRLRGSPNGSSMRRARTRRARCSPASASLCMRTGARARACGRRRARRWARATRRRRTAAASPSRARLARSIGLGGVIAGACATPVRRRRRLGRRARTSRARMWR